MGYTNETTHYGLPLPLGSDLTTPMDYNTSLQDVDTALFGAVSDCASMDTRLDVAEGNISTAQGDITALNGRMTTAEGKISTLEGTSAQHTLDIADVRADGQDMITAYKEATAQSTHEYHSGDYFIYNDVLYKATTTIGVGDTIVPDTNCETTNVTSELLVLAIANMPVELSPIWSTVHLTNRAIWLYRIGKIVYYNFRATLDDDRATGLSLVEVDSTTNGVNGIKADQTNSTQNQTGIINIVRDGSNILKEIIIRVNNDTHRVEIASAVPLNSGDIITVHGYFRTN